MPGQCPPRKAANAELSWLKRVTWAAGNRDGREGSLKAFGVQMMPTSAPDIDHVATAVSVCCMFSSWLRGLWFTMVEKVWGLEHQATCLALD